MSETINAFMNTKRPQILQIIAGFEEREFNSHEFIEKFAKTFEMEYIEFLYHYRENHAFQTVHGQIAWHLSENKGYLDIKKTETVKSRNVFGDDDYIQGWIQK